MRGTILGLIAGALLVGSMSARATEMRLDATTQDGTVATSWYTTFNDTGDGKFSLPELTYFSTAECYTCADGFGGFGVTLLSIVGVPDGTYTGDLTVGPYTTWLFIDNSSPFGQSLPPDTWTYRISSVTVPEPSTAALFGLGLAGLRLSQRRATSSRT